MGQGMRIRIDYSTVYEYDRPAAGVMQLLRVEPRRHDDLNILDWRVELDADGALRAGTDAFGNRTHSFYAERPIERLTLRVTGEVISRENHGIIRGLDEPLAPRIYLRTTPLTAPDAALAAFSAGIAAPSTLDWLHALLLALREAIVFDAEATGPGTGAAQAFALGRGVCQDFSHIFIAACRLKGIPARYVSGHFVHGDGDAVHPATHAWAEAYVEDLGWVGFDTTNGVSTGDAHVRVAAGLDYSDAAPVRGARRGGGEEAMTVAARAWDLAAPLRQAQSQSQAE